MKKLHFTCVSVMTMLNFTQLDLITAAMLHYGERYKNYLVHSEKCETDFENSRLGVKNSSAKRS